MPDVFPDFKPPEVLHFEGIASKGLSDVFLTAFAFQRPVTLDNCFVSSFEQKENGSYSFTFIVEAATIHNAEKPKKLSKIKFIVG